MPRIGRVAPGLALLLACIAPVLAAGATRAPADETVRGVPPIDRSVVAAVDVDAFAAHDSMGRDGNFLRYRLLVPERLEPGKRYPLVVQFHSSGGIGSDNRSQIETAAKAWALPQIRRRYPAFVLVPQFPVRSANYDDPANPRSAQASAMLSTALELVHQLVAEQPVDPRRIYATGFSMGGSAAWLAPTLRPGLFAAAVPVSGIAPDRSQAALLKDLPLLVLHGDADTENPIDADREMVRTIRALGGRHVRLREYAGLAHAPPGDLIPGDWWRDWLFAQQRGPR
jgi:predicted peptidase